MKQSKSEGSSIPLEDNSTRSWRSKLPVGGKRKPDLLQSGVSFDDSIYVTRDVQLHSEPGKTSGPYLDGSRPKGKFIPIEERV